MYGRRLSVWKWHVLTNRWATDSIRLWFNKHEGGHINHCWVNDIQASLPNPLTSTSLLTISSLIEERIIEMDDHPCTYTSTPPSEDTRWNAITYNPYNDELQREWLELSSICTHLHAHARSCIHLNAHACIWTECMEWVFSGHAYVRICMHMDTYGCTCMHMHAESV